jgi:hypothetical protein
MSYNCPRKSSKISVFKGGVAEFSDTMKCEAVLLRTISLKGCGASGANADGP